MNAALPHDTELPFVACVPVSMDFFDRAPVCFRYTKDLPVSPERLFAIFEDPDAWSRWATGIGGVEWTSPKPYGVGTTRTVTFWGGMKVYEDFIAWEPGREMSFTFYGTTELVWTSFAEHYKVEPTAEGCRLTWTVAYEPAGPFGRIHPLIKPVMYLNLRSYLWRLKRYCRRNP